MARTRDMVADALADCHQERKRLLARVRSLEAGLVEYGLHKAACEQALLNASIRDGPWVCSCGLADLAGEAG